MMTEKSTKSNNVAEKIVKTYQCDDRLPSSRPSLIYLPLDKMLVANQCNSGSIDLAISKFFLRLLQQFSDYVYLRSLRRLAVVE